MARAARMLAAAVCVIATVAATPGKGEGTPHAYMIVRSGELPIILSAPHGGSDPLPGVATRRHNGKFDFAISRDLRTLELGERLADAIARKLGRAPFVVFARFQRRHVDANRPPADAYDQPGDNGPKAVYDAYHQALSAARAQVQATFGRGILLDIHGQAGWPQAILRGTRNGAAVAHLLKRYGDPSLRGPHSIFGVLAAKGYQVAPDLATGGREQLRGAYILQTHGSARGGTVDAIQLEIGADLRAPAKLDQTAEALADAVAVFAKEYLPLDPQSRGPRR